MVTKLTPLDHAIKAFEIKLSKFDITILEEPFIPHRLVEALLVLTLK